MYSGLIIRKVGDTYRVIYESSSIAEVRFIGTLEECEYFVSLGNLCYRPEIIKYVRNIKDLKTWL